MSKSLGNSVSPDEIIEKYGTDAFRYFFLRHISSYSDGDFNWERFEEVYNNELANELGNAVSRTAAMINKFRIRCHRRHTKGRNTTSRHFYPPWRMPL